MQNSKQDSVEIPSHFIERERVRKKTEWHIAHASIWLKLLLCAEVHIHKAIFNAGQQVAKRVFGNRLI